MSGFAAGFRCGRSVEIRFGIVRCFCHGILLDQRGSLKCPKTIQAIIASEKVLVSSNVAIAPPPPDAGRTPTALKIARLRGKTAKSRRDFADYSDGVN
jgi:hypothetical protein